MHQHVANFYVSLQSMKKILFIICIISVCAGSLAGQNRIILPDSTQLKARPDSLSKRTAVDHDHDHDHDGDHDHDHDHKKEVGHDHPEVDSLLAAVRILTWNVDPRTGERYSVVLDTVYPNYQHTTLPDGESVATGFLGPLGSPTISKIFFDRKEKSQFVFSDPFYPYNKNPENNVFFNTALPYSRLTYQSAGSDRMKEERFKALLSINANRFLNIGLDGDIISSKGFYNAQSVKYSDWKLHGNYVSDRLEAHAFVSTSSSTNIENGGIVKDGEGFITRPDTIQRRFVSRDIPVLFTKTWNRLKTDQAFIAARYNLGYTKNLKDSLHKGQGEFVPIASLSFSSHYKQQYRRFLSHDTAFVNAPNGAKIHKIDQFYKERFYSRSVDDSIRHSSFKNTVALSLREGFREWVKFGLTGFLQHELCSFSMIDKEDTKNLSVHRENAVTIGGVLSKQQGEFLKFDIQADLGVLGANLGEFRAMGTVETGVKIAGKRTTLTGEAYIKNLKPKYLEKSYHSKYFWWDKDFGDIRRVYVGGKLFVPFTNTTLSVGVENIQNYIYFDKDKNITQESGNIQVLSARVDQNVQFGVFHWDNQLVYQTSSNEQAVPLPKLSVYTNMYLKARIVSDFMMQFGIDAHYHTAYFSPGYEPALLQFYNQREREIGNYPIATIYANMRIKRTRFFVMMYNVAPWVWKPSDYFSLPGYALNPTMLKIGLAWNLHN